MEATMVASPAAMAPAAAESAATPGVAGGRGELLDEGLDSGAQASDRHLSAMTAVRRFSRISDDRSSQLAGTIPAACSSAFFGISPTISLETGTTPYRAASRFTISNTPVDGRLLEIGEVHGNLGQPRTRNPAPFHKTYATAREANRLGYLLGVSTSGRIEENV